MTLRLRIMIMHHEKSAAWHMSRRGSSINLCVLLESVNMLFCMVSNEEAEKEEEKEKSVKEVPLLGKFMFLQ